MKMGAPAESKTVLPHPNMTEQMDNATTLMPAAKNPSTADPNGKRLRPTSEAHAGALWWLRRWRADQRRLVTDLPVGSRE